MAHIIIVTGSARPHSISHKVAPLVEKALTVRGGISAQIIDVAKLELPFMNAPFPPSHPDFVATDEHVKAWTQQVADADAVVLLTPEYNGNVTAIQKNAIDWIYKEWNGKPVAFIGYGWYEPSRAHAALRVSFEQTLKAKLVEPFAQLQFMKDITVEGDVMDQSSIDEKLTATLEALAAALS
jgi:NAD(P)H-dependent FMN reductase